MDADEISWTWTIIWFNLINLINGINLINEEMDADKIRLYYIFVGKYFAKMNKLPAYTVGCKFG